MNKQFKLSIICLVVLLMSAMSVQAGISATVTASASSNCEEVTVSWSNASGVSATITIYLGGTSTVIRSGSFSGNPGSATIDIDPDLADGDAIEVYVEVNNSGGSPLGYADFPIACAIPDESVVVVEDTSLCRDGRLTYTQCNPLVVYNVISDDGVGLIIYTADPESNGIGEFKLEIPAETFSALPANPEVNCMIASSADGTVVVYLLTTGEIQINAGPDNADNKVFVYIFSDLVSAPTSIDTYTTLDALEILPSC